VRHDFREDGQLTKAARDELRILRTEIKDNDSLMCHAEYHYYKRVGLSVVRLNIVIFCVLLSASPGSGAAGATPAPRIDALPMVNQWTRSVDGPPPAAAAADSTRVVAGWADHFEVFALATGDRDWGLPIPATRVACDGAFCVVANDTDIRGIDLDRHAVRWQQRLSAPLSATPAMRGGWVVLTTATGRVRALQAVDGREVWQFDAGGAVIGAPSINGTRVALSTARHAVTLIDIATGHGLWSKIIDSQPGAPCLGGGVVVIGTDDGRLVTLDDDSGRLRFEYRMGASLTGAPTLDERHVYTVGLDGVLRAFDRGNGAQRWYKNLDTRVANAPTVDGDLVLVPLRNGVVDVRLNDGRVAGRFPGPADDARLRIAVPPIVTGTGATLTVITAWSDVNDTTQWSLTRLAGGARLSTSAWPSPPAAIPGLALTLTPPR
jgi:outer membrane protein assembly factor BamB